MEHSTAAPQPAPPAAAPAVGVPVASESVVLSMQKTVGNRAVCRAIASGMLARDDAPGAATPTAGGAITGFSVSPTDATMPLESGVTITAKVTPDGTGAKLSLEAGTVAPAAGTKIDDSGKVTLDGKQPGGTIKINAEAANKASTGFRVIEKPKEIASTAPSATGTYQGAFTHTFSSSGATTAGLNQANINEKFDSTSAKTPFGGPDFKLTANKANSAGWLLNTSGTMNLPDNVSLSQGLDASQFVNNASNPKPAAALPQGFDMTQKFHFKALPSGKLEDAPFTTTTHGRHLVEDGGKLKVKLSAGKEKVLIDYAGPPVFRNASADKTTVEASAPKPKTGTWKQNKVQCKVDVEPSGGAVKWSISSSDKLGCSVDSTGEVKIGDKAGSITVRAGDGKHFDEVTITITAPAGAAGAKPTSDEGAGEAAPAMDTPVEPLPPQPAGEQAPPPQDQGTPPDTAT